MASAVPGGLTRQQWDSLSTQQKKQVRMDSGAPSAGGGYEPLARPRSTGSSAASRGSGGFTIQYDDGIITGTSGIASQALVNRFNTYKTTGGNGGALPGSQYTVTRVTFDMVNTFFNSAVFSLYDEIAGNTARQVTSMALSGVMTGPNTFAIGNGGTMNVVSGGSFLAGIWQFNPTNTGLAVGTGTTRGQGHKAASLNDGAVGTGLTDLPGLNAVFRVSVIGDLPVELAAAVCGDGSVDGDEECDDAGESDSCDADCTIVACGDGTINTTAGEDCDDISHACCSAGCTFEAAGTACGDATNDECTNSDTCDGAGTCDANHASAGTACGDQGIDCLVDDTCDGAGACTDNGFEAAGTGCGDATDGECTDPDSCDGAGTCDTNHAAVGTGCGDQGIDCLVDDACDGAGACTDNGFEAVGTGCGDATDGECTDPDSCDGAGTCDTNHSSAGTACGDQGIECQVDDACDGSGACTDNGFEAAGTACGDATDGECTNPDSCDGAGSCDDNHEQVGAACGDQGADCLVDDQCDGSGSCTDNGIAGAGTACGDPTSDDCTAPDTCDAAGTCLDNHQTDGGACGAGGACVTAGTCSSGVCTGGAPTDCNDNNPCTTDSCDPVAGCVNDGSPVSGCYEAERGQFLVVDGRSERADKIKFKWWKGDAYSCSDIGNVGTLESFDLCVYDTNAGTAVAAGGLTFASTSGWQERNGCRWRYSDPSGSVAGLKAFNFMPGEDGETRVTFKGGGTNLDEPASLGGGRFFNMDPSVTVQVLSDGGACWTADFTTSYVNRNNMFKTKKGVRVFVP